ncbi:MAG: transposase zinc-binding domain-containing protein [Anaerolineae bacterium]|nr:transposase zinc-binding domain-containing protein [Anaerolineae bacterium]
MEETRQQWTFRTIVEDKDNWQRYQEEYEGEVSPDQLAEVEKMLGCGKAENGFATYICLNCGETKRVCFSCKSRVCSRSILSG